MRPVLCWWWWWCNASLSLPQSLPLKRDSALKRDKAHNRPPPSLPRSTPSLSSLALYSSFSTTSPKSSCRGRPAGLDMTILDHFRDHHLETNCVERRERSANEEPNPLGTVRPTNQFRGNIFALVPLLHLSLAPSSAAAPVARSFGSPPEVT